MTRFPPRSAGRGGWIIFRVVGGQLLPPIAFLLCAAPRAGADTAAPRQETAEVRSAAPEAGTLPTQDPLHPDPPQPGPSLLGTLHHPSPATLCSGAAQLGASTRELSRGSQTPLESGTCKNRLLDPKK